MTHISIREGARSTLANGRPAFTRGGFVTQAMIDRYGSYSAARLAMAAEKEICDD